MRVDAPRRLHASLWRAFVLQILLISATAFASVYLAEFAIRELLIVSALEREADYFWSRRKISQNTPAPNTNSLIGYVFERGEEEEVPAEFSGLEPGLHDVLTPIGEAVVHVSEYEGARLYLVFDANNVIHLATYFGIVPLALLLVVLYCSAWVAYRITQRAVSPVIRLARSVRDIDLETPDLSAFADIDQSGNNAEIAVLARALQHLLGRVDRFIERERLFTREASHELRSPLTVIRMASDNLLNRSGLEPGARLMAERIRRAAQDMEELTEVLLLLAREHEGALVCERVIVNDVVAQEINACRIVFGHKHLDWSFTETTRICVHGTQRMVAIVFGNLLRNACAYTDSGTVEVRIEGHRVTITDSGIGMSRERLGRLFSPADSHHDARGNGIGLNLVKRISDRFDWQIEIYSRPGEGTSVAVILSDAEVAPIAPGALQRSHVA